MKLGADLFAILNAKQRVGNQKPVIYGQGGLWEVQLDQIERKLGFPLPPDFRYLLANVRDDDQVLFPWARFEKQEYDSRITRVIDGIAFDIEHNALWLERWGTKPSNLADSIAIMCEDFKTWPKLLPIYGHRFLAAEPCAPGNPVFSIWQTDIIYYGATIAHYLLNEFVAQNFNAHVCEPPIHHINIWSDFVC